MVFYRRKNYARTKSRRSSYRRYGLSKRRIYSRTSAKSQASQIDTLNRRINSINKRFRPEIKTHHNAVDSHTFTNSLIADSYYVSYYMMPGAGTGDEDRIGDKIYIKNIQWNLTFEYYNNSTTGYHNGESAGCPVRVMILKTKIAESYGTYYPTLNNILLYSSNSGTEYTQRAVSPWVHGITDTYKILYNKVFYLTTTKNQKVLRIFTKGGLQQWDTTGNKCYQYYLVVAPAGLHQDADFTENIQMTLSKKMAFVDY